MDKLRNLIDSGKEKGTKFVKLKLPLQSAHDTHTPSPHEKNTVPKKRTKFAPLVQNVRKKKTFVR